MSRTDPRSLPVVDVLMPVFNGRAFLDEQIQSILAQEGVAVVLHVLDDGSTDESWDLISDWAQRDFRVQGIRRPANAGLGAALDALVGLARNDYFALADQDDVWDATKIRHSIEQLRGSGASLTFSRVRVIDGSGHLTAKDYHEDRGVRWYAPSTPYACVFENPVIGHTIVATRELAESVNHSFTEAAFHEVLLVARALELSGVAPLDRTLGCYRQHGRNVTGARRRSHISRLYQRVSKADQLIVRHSIRRRAVMTLGGERLVASLGLAADQKRSARAVRALRLFAFVRTAYDSGGTAIALREVGLNVLTPRYPGPVVG